ncbi:DUF2326 domain-containing protein [Bacillus siamensis]|uniref:DUF2326 domain-containing protein n=1 Tax=Bacillus siamensis TaxID=659243 RepID=UPI002E221C29|nr:DUF2326 domain-containing protein [Bacillus siamensis]MED5095413.1 DUF2326 domain-containing protein [Bacillus siamensis]
MNLEEGEILALKEYREEKSYLVRKITSVANRLNRIERNIKNEFPLPNENLEKLTEFFPNIKVKKIEDINKFHINISQILDKQLENSLNVLKDEKRILETRLSDLDRKIDDFLYSFEEDNELLNNLNSLYQKKYILETENESYERNEAIKRDISKKKDEIDKIKGQTVSELNQIINKSIKKVNQFIYQSTKKAPQLKLDINNYEYINNENTGTGAAYKNLILFDLAVFETSELPFIIHDSFLFKNIEIPAIERIIEFYSSSVKQIFIAIDEAQKYKEEVKNIIQQNAIVLLDESKTLFVKDWSK